MQDNNNDFNRKIEVLLLVCRTITTISIEK